jgi:hypothetical protein
MCMMHLLRVSLLIARVFGVFGSVCLDCSLTSLRSVIGLVHGWLQNTAACHSPCHQQHVSADRLLFMLMSAVVAIAWSVQRPPSMPRTSTVPWWCEPTDCVMARSSDAVGVTPLQCAAAAVNCGRLCVAGNVHCALPCPVAAVHAARLALVPVSSIKIDWHGQVSYTVGQRGTADRCHQSDGHPGEVGRGC